jgi:hypothetical protein
MIQIGSISNYEVRCKIKTPSQDNSGSYVDAVILLNENLQVKMLGVKGDIMITPDDLTSQEVYHIQSEINNFIHKVQNLKELDLSKENGSFYRVKNTVLMSYASDNSDVKDESQWCEVSELTDLSILKLINDFFKTHFDSISFRP